MSWEDILKRGRVPPKKPTKEETDTGWSKPKPKERPLTPERRKEILDSFREENKRDKKRREGLNVLDRILEDSERESRIEEEERRKNERKNRKPRYVESEEAREKREWNELREKRAESRRIKAAKRAGTYRPKNKGQKRNPRQQAPKKTRSQRKAANAAKARREANQEAQRREDAARDARNRRRGL